MKLHPLFCALAALPVLVAGNAHALRRIDPVHLFDFLVNDISVGVQGFPGGPVQIYPVSGYGYVYPNGVDWVDFSLDGTTLTFGEGNPGTYSLVSPTPFFFVSGPFAPATTGGRPTYDVSFPPGAETLDLVDPATGISTTVTVTPVPEPAAWAMMLIGVGGLGAILRGRRQPKFATA